MKEKKRMERHRDVCLNRARLQTTFGNNTQKGHFDPITIQPPAGTHFSVEPQNQKQGKNTLKHISALASGDVQRGYTVSLASYDLFPMLALQPGQTAVENDPSQVDVYVDSNTQSLNTAALGIGSTFRFYGLAFNDNGRLRMDCAQVNDGVAFSTQSTSAAKSAPDQLRIIRYRGQGTQQTTTKIKGPE